MICDAWFLHSVVADFRISTLENIYIIDKYRQMHSVNAYFRNVDLNHWHDYWAPMRGFFNYREPRESDLVSRNCSLYLQGRTSDWLVW